ncbi:auxin efflux carrier [Rhypophila decipiens]|uniref:Auxin efflux carrier n=1 Tax=Rhypophila decipiens TaxID=261697 RepID=A0AAN7B808_9PEZI|nr:auxin efflux carrier [Rhypophila decipiens]
MSGNTVSSIVVPFLGAIQASISALLTIGVGVAAAQWGLLNNESSKHISRVCVKVFLPFLLIANLGEQLELDTVQLYVPILIWALSYTLLSLLVGKAASYIFKLPPWTIPAVAFNNSTSLPLLLLQSLKTSGILSSLVGENEYESAIERAKSFFLMCAVVSNTLSLGQGGKHLKGFEEDVPDDVIERMKQLANDAGDRAGDVWEAATGDEENGNGRNSDAESDDGEQEEDPSEQTSLLPHRVFSFAKRTNRRINGFGNRMYNSLPKPLQSFVDWISPFLNPALLGAVIGAIIGLTPPLQRLFFNQTDEGGYLNAWLTTPIKNVGELFVTLQVLVVGVKLSLSLRKLKEGHEEAGDVPWRAIVFVTMWRFIILPALAVPFIWALASYSPVLFNDPILWFAMMMMPAGPPAMRLLALADVNNAGEAVKMSVARFLTILYGLTPLIAFTVVGALKAAESAKNMKNA